MASPKLQNKQHEWQNVNYYPARRFLKKCAKAAGLILLVGLVAGIAFAIYATFGHNASLNRLMECFYGRVKAAFLTHKTLFISLSASIGGGILASTSCYFFYKKCIKNRQHIYIDQDF